MSLGYRVGPPLRQSLGTPRSGAQCQSLKNNTFKIHSSDDQVLTNYAESIESYQRAIAIVSTPNPTVAELSLYRSYKDAVMEVKDKILNPQTMYVVLLPIRIRGFIFQRSLPVLMAMARAHDIPVPTPHTLDYMPAIHQAIWYHPKFTTDPLLCLFLIPQRTGQLNGAGKRYVNS
jgi:hypothetical protein